MEDHQSITQTPSQTSQRDPHDDTTTWECQHVVHDIQHVTTRYSRDYVQPQTTSQEYWLIVVWKKGKN